MNSVTAKKSEMVFIPGPEGELEGIFSYVSKKVTHLAVLCHPHPLYGGTMHNKVIYSIAMALNQIGFATVRFNFRGVGRSSGSFNHGIGEQKDVEAVMDHFHKLYPDALKVIGGFSFGSKVGLMAATRDDRVSAVLGAGVTVDVADFSFLNDYERPKLIVQGSLDQYGQPESVREWFRHLREPKKLVFIEGAVHLFDGKLTELKNAIIQEFPQIIEQSAFVKN
ncbi:MAG TPA: alpha/beta fold hydrolase [Acidobacteriota bacterium]|jgi:alpha/beta superfamily hydrolase|nr:alpha/beta fold hydrolase [Acidobacteriota bacterium]